MMHDTTPDAPTPAAGPRWRRPEALLMLLALGMALCFAVWSSLITNFAIDNVGLDAVQFGFLQSWREAPGLLSFTVIAALLLMREQPLAHLSLIMLGFGIAMTGYPPSFWGLMT